MSWSITRHLHIDVYAQYGSVLMVGATNTALLQPPPDCIAGDTCPVNLHFWERQSDGSLIAADPGAGCTIILSGRRAGVPSGSSLLFLCNAFTRLSDGLWAGTLNLNTAEFLAFMSSASNVATTILGEVEVRLADNSARTSLQFDLMARPQVYADSDTPVTALPTPDAWLEARRPSPILRTTGDGAPVNGAIASLTVDPTGTNNTVIYTAVTEGASGNSISVTYATPVAQPNTGVSVTGNAITVTPGTKVNLTCSGTTPALAACVAVWYPGSSSWIYTSDGVASYGSIPGVARTAWYNDGTKWWVWQWNSSGTLLFQASSTTNGSTPDGLAYVVTTGTGTMSVTGGTSTAAQVIAAVNANTAAAALVTATASGTVTGTVAAISSANLSGGITGTAALAGQECYVNLTTVYKCVQSNPVKWVALN